MRYMTEEYRGFHIIYDTMNGWADVVSPDEQIERRVLAEDDTIENCAHSYVDVALAMDETDRKYEAAEANYEEDDYLGSDDWGHGNFDAGPDDMESQ